MDISNNDSKLYLNIDYNRDYIGVVEDNKDDEFSLRCKVRVFGVYDDLKVEDMPWAYPASCFIFSSQNGGFGFASVPKVGTFVKVRFNNGNIYAPEYYAIQNIDDALKNELSNDYDGSQVLLYDKDADLKIIYQKNSGLKIYLKESFISINPDSSITIRHKDNSSIVELVGDVCRVVTNNQVNITSTNKVEVTSSECILNGTQKTQLGPTGNYSAVGSEPLWAFLKSLSTALDAKFPATPGVNASLAETYEKLSTSLNNKISVP